MSPLQALELVRGFAAAVQESDPDSQSEVVLRVFGRVAIRDERVVDVDVYPIYQVVFTTPSGFGGAPPATSTLPFRSSVAVW